MAREARSSRPCRARSGRRRWRLRAVFVVPFLQLVVSPIHDFTIAAGVGVELQAEEHVDACLLGCGLPARGPALTENMLRPAPYRAQRLVRPGPVRPLPADLHSDPVAVEHENLVDTTGRQWLVTGPVEQGGGGHCPPDLSHSQRVQWFRHRGGRLARRHGNGLDQHTTVTTQLPTNRRCPGLRQPAPPAKAGQTKKHAAPQGCTTRLLIAEDAPRRMSQAPSTRTERTDERTRASAEKTYAMCRSLMLQ